MSDLIFLKLTCTKIFNLLFLVEAKAKIRSSRCFVRVHVVVYSKVVSRKLPGFVTFCGRRRTFFKSDVGHTRYT